MDNNYLEDDAKRGGMFSTMVKKISTTENWIRKHDSVKHVGSGVVLVKATALSVGYIPFGIAEGLVGEDAGLFWDNTNKRLGLGTTVPSNPLDVNGNVNLGGHTIYGGITREVGTGELVNLELNYGRLAAQNTTYWGGAFSIDTRAANDLFHWRAKNTTGTETQVMTLDRTGNLTITGLVNLKNYTVATLPAGTRGDIAYCTDLLLPGFLAVAVGGGAIVGPVFKNSTQWVTF